MIKKLTSQAAKQEEFNERTAQLCYCWYLCNPDLFNRYEEKIGIAFPM